MIKKMRQMAMTVCLIPGLLFGQSDHENSLLANNSSTSFKEVTAQLDPGGSLYFYLSLKEMVKGLSQRVDRWEDPSSYQTLDQRKRGHMFYKLMTKLVQKSGIEDFSGMGASTIEQGDLSLSKFVLQHLPGKNSGFLWSMFGEKPHSLDALGLLPTTTVLAFFTDTHLRVLWSTIEDIANTEIPDLKEHLQMVKNDFPRETGVELDQMLDSFGGEYGMIVTMDDVKKMSLPIGLETQIPEPNGMLVIKVNNDMFYNYMLKMLAEEGRKIVNLDTDNLKMRKVLIPLIFSEVPFFIARSGDYLFLSSSEELVQEVVAVKNGKVAGLQSTGDFKQLAKGMPQQGNAFSYVSKRLFDTMRDVYLMTFDEPFGISLLPPWLAPLQGLYSGFTSLENGGYSVSLRTPEGWLSVGQQK